MGSLANIIFDGATTYTTSTTNNMVSTNIDISDFYAASDAGVPFQGAVSPVSGSGRPLLLRQLDLEFSSSAGAGKFVARRNSSRHPDQVSGTEGQDYGYSSAIGTLNGTVSRQMNFPLFQTDVLYVGFIKSDGSTTRITTESASGYNVVYSYGDNATTGTIASGKRQTAELEFWTIPTAVQSLNATDNGNGTVSVSWNAPLSDGGTSVTGYRISYNSGGAWTHTTTTSTSATLTLSDGTYTVRVCALNAVTDVFNSNYGWTDDSYMMGTASEDTVTVTSSYTVTLDANGGSVTTSSYSVTPGQYVSLNNASWTGKTFVGWYTSPTYNQGTQVSSYYLPTASITLYARWEYAVTFQANGGNNGGTISVGVNPSNGVALSNVTAPSSTRTGYTFLGWYNSESSGTLVYNANSTFTPTANVTYYAYWRGTVSFDSNGGSAVAAITYVDGESITLPSTSRSGYTFGGWETSTGSFIGNAGGTSTPTTSPLTYYARWTALAVSWSDSSLNTSLRKGQPYTVNNSVSASYVSSWVYSGLPSGLTFNGGTNLTGLSTSTISGTPTVYGNYTVSLTPKNVDNIAGNTYTYSFVVDDVELQWSDQVLATNIAIQGDTAYSDQVSVVAGPTTTYSVTPGYSLPTGLELNSSTGALTANAINGITAAPGVYAFKIRATNGTLETLDTNTLTITVEAAGGYVKVWNGTAWVDGTAYVYNGSTWVEGTVQVNNGVGWTDSFST